MNNKKIVLGIGAAIFLQFAVLTGMYIISAVPLWTGNEVRVETMPYDPRSLFRGNYARLRYKITQIEKNKFPQNTFLRKGEQVYVSLKLDADGLYVFDSVSLSRPDEGVFIRGRIDRSHTNDYIVKYGIEAFFTAKDKAIALEKNLTKGGVAVLMIASNGKAALKDVLPKE